MDDLTSRVQSITSKIEKLKVKKIEDETNIKRYTEDLAACEGSLKELGYNSIEEAKAALEALEKNLKQECADLETQLADLGI